MSAGYLPPYQPGGRGERDGRQAGEGPAQQDGGGHLCAGPGASAAAQDSQGTELGDPESARGDGQDGQ
jgi:hypothetical protein